MQVLTICRLYANTLNKYTNDNFVEEARKETCKSKTILTNCNLCRLCLVGRIKKISFLPFVFGIEDGKVIWVKFSYVIKKKKKKIENGKVKGWKTNKNFLCLVDKKNERIEKIVW